MKKLSIILMVLALCLPGTIFAAQAKKNPLAAWQPKFDPSGAEYKYILSNISHPAIEGVGVGYRIRDKVWEKSGGRLYVDFRPLAQLVQRLNNSPPVCRNLKYPYFDCYEVY